MNTNPYAVSNDAQLAAYAEVGERTAFIQRTYMHLAAAIIGFVVLEGLILTAFPPQVLYQKLGPLLQGWGWLVVLGAFMGVSWLARSWADSGSSRGLQYAGLTLYVIAEAIIFLPLMAGSLIIDPTGSIPMQAGVITAIVFGGLTAMVFLTGADFSWLDRYLWLAGIGAMAVIVVGIFLPGGFGLGLWFSGAMVVLAAGYILFDTSNIVHRYNTHQHVAASLALFASVALLFWYVMQILMSMRDE